MDSGLFDKHGRRVVHPVGQGVPMEPEPENVSLETAGRSPMARRVAAGNAPEETPSLQNRFIRGLPSKQHPRGKILGVAGGIKKVNASKETPYYNLLESWWCGNNGMTPEEREEEKKKALAKVKAESSTPFYDSLVQEDMTTADVASFELPLRNGGLSQQFDKELDRRRKKKYYKLAMITASMGGAGDSY